RARGAAPLRSGTCERRSLKTGAPAARGAGRVTWVQFRVAGHQVAWRAANLRSCPVVPRRNAESGPKAANEMAEVTEADRVPDVGDAHLLAIGTLEPLRCRVDASLENVAARREAHLPKDALDTPRAHVELFGDPADVQVRVAEVPLDEGARLALRITAAG